MSITYRLASEKDVGEISVMLEDLGDFAAERKGSIRKVLSDADGEMLVALVNGSLVGIVHQVFFEDPLHGGECSLITSLFVKKDARRKGVASGLLQKALETARVRDVKEVHVPTLESNAAAVKLYERLGFRKEGILLEINP